METFSVVLTNRKAQFLCSPETQVSIKEFFRYHPPGYKFSFKFRSGIWDGWVNLMRRGSVASGLFLDVLPELQKVFKLRILDKREFPTFKSEYPVGISGKLRQHQTACVEAMVQNSNQGGLVIQATGAGKTFTAGAYLSKLNGYGLFVVDELGLLEQAREELAGMLGSNAVGVVGRGEFNPKRITVATIQTLNLNQDNRSFQDWFKKLEVVLIDEIHIALNRSNTDIIKTIKPKAVFGLTATLELDKPEVRMRAIALAGPPIFSYTAKQGEDEGHLCKSIIVRVLFPASGLGLDKESEYCKMIVSGKRNDCVAALAREGVLRNHRVVVIVERLAHLAFLSKRLEDVKHQVLSGAYKTEVRTAARKAMDAGKLSLILANRVFAKGANIKTNDVVIDATGLPGHNAAQQRHGRGRRTEENKRGLIHIDIADCNSGGKPNRFSRSSKSRLLSLRELGSPIISIPWESASEIYDKAEKSLKRVKAV